jgi:hypothetical protein
VNFDAATEAILLVGTELDEKLVAHIFELLGPLIALCSVGDHVFVTEVFVSDAVVVPGEGDFATGVVGETTEGQEAKASGQHHFLVLDGLR